MRATSDLKSFGGVNASPVYIRHQKFPIAAPADILINTDRYWAIGRHGIDWRVTYIYLQVSLVINDSASPLLVRWRHSKWPTRSRKFPRHFEYFYLPTHSQPPCFEIIPLFIVFQRSVLVSKLGIGYLRSNEMTRMLIKEANTLASNLRKHSCVIAASWCIYAKVK